MSNVNPIFNSPVIVTFSSVASSTAVQEVVYIPSDLTTFFIDSIVITMSGAGAAADDVDIDLATDSSFTDIIYNSTAIDLDSTNPTTLNADTIAQGLTDNKFYVKITHNNGNTSDFEVSMTLAVIADEIPTIIQNSEPTLSADGAFALWIDNTSGPPYPSYLLYRRGTGDQTAVELA